MLKSYIKVAIRTLLKNKSFSCINIFGLAIGIACCTLIAFFLHQEFAYDTFHHEPESIYRVLPDLPTIKVASLPFPLIPTLAESYPEIEQAVRLYAEGGHVKIGDETFAEKIIYADPDFFDMFDFPLVAGDLQNALDDRLSVVLSETAAKKYFGDGNPIGKTMAIIHTAHVQLYTVRGIAAAIPNESSIQFSILLPFENLKYGRHAQAFENWQQFLVTGFIRLQKNTQVTVLAEKIPAFLYKNMQIDLSDALYDPPPRGLKFQPLSAYHRGDVPAGPGLEPVGNRTYLYILTAVAILILLMACFNFINLTIGSASARFKEVGMRKVLGAQRSQLVRQFWLEATLMSFIAFVIGLILADLFLPEFNTLLQADFSSGFSSFFILGAVVLLIGIAAGSYPALLISSFETVDIFKGRFKIGGSNPATRLMIVVQFVISICLVISVLVLNRQLGFLREYDLGFNPENVIVIPTQVNETKKNEGAKLLEYYKKELAGNPNIVNISGATGSFQRWFPILSFFTMEDGRVMDVARYGVDANFIETVGLELLAGRNFREGESDLHHSMIVNETFMQTFPEIARLESEFPYRIYMRKRRKIIGIVRDFNFESFKKDGLARRTAFRPERRGRI